MFAKMLAVHLSMFGVGCPSMMVRHYAGLGQGLPKHTLPEWTSRVSRHGARGCHMHSPHARNRSASAQVCNLRLVRGRAGE